MDEVVLFGCPVHAARMGEALDAVEAIVAEGRAGAPPRQVVFLNAAKFVAMDSNAALDKSVRAADLRFADGQSVVWASRLLGVPLPERVAGVDMMHRLLERGAAHGWRFFFLGARDEVLQKAMEEARRLFPGVVIAGHRNGYFSAGDESAVAAQVREAGADILFVGMPSPKKEEFVDRRLGDMGVTFTMGVGGSFDVLAGKTARAPLFVQRIGMEWAYRMMQEPGRMWRRYLVGNTLFLWKTLKCRLGMCACCGAGGGS